MALLAFLFFGLVVGLLARALMPGDQRMGVFLTMGLGLAGSLVGGFLVSLIFGHSFSEFHTAGLIGSVVGAIAILAVAGMLSRRSELV